MTLTGAASTALAMCRWRCAGGALPTSLSPGGCWVSSLHSGRCEGLSHRHSPSQGDSAAWGRALSSWMLHNDLPGGAGSRYLLGLRTGQEQVGRCLWAWVLRQGRKVCPALSRTVSVGRGDLRPLNVRPPLLLLLCLLTICTDTIFI